MAEPISDQTAHNAIPVDVEDWLQSVVDPEHPLTDRFFASTRTILKTFAAHDVHGTFFVLGLAAEKAPELVREIRQAGHEIQSHGYGHRPLHTLTPKQFRQDLDRSKKLLEDLIGQPVTGYRAPMFSITRRTLWALDLLVEVGFEYDSSVFPVTVRGYGIKGAPWYPHRLKTPAGHELLELPVASYRRFGCTIPIGGGGYLRLFPYQVIRNGIRQINNTGYPATIYMHPYEHDPMELRESSYPLSWKQCLHQGLGRRGFPRKIDRLLTDFPFDTMGTVTNSLGSLPYYEHRRSDR